LISKIKVSVIIPTYNRSYTLKKTIDSVLNQTHRNIEIIVIDDGSTDNTCEVLNNYKNRLQVINQDNQGPSKARNNGSRHATGDYIAFVDSDDIWHPRRIEEQLVLITNTDAKCCICNCILESSKGLTTTSFQLFNIKTKYPNSYLLNPFEIAVTRFLLINQVVLLKKKVFDDLGGYNEELKILEDHELALRLSLLGKWCMLNKILVSKYESKKSIGREARKSEDYTIETVIHILKELKINNHLNKEYITIVDGELKKLGDILKYIKLAKKPNSFCETLIFLMNSFNRFKYVFYKKFGFYPRAISCELSILK
jgi:glycosyltransferase involved in cell wall biosynthesis